jgi:lipopolysaccharide transport system permease protein
MIVVQAIARSSRRMLGIIYRYRKMLVAMTRVELAKRHAGSILGMSWVVLQPALLLSVYVFVYMVVLRMRFEGFSRFDYVLYVFCGLVPYLGFMEALTTGALSVKQNIHLVKNVMLPIELIPVRSVIVGMASQFVSIVLVLALVAVDRSLSPLAVLLPLVVILQVMWLTGLTWVLSSVAVALPDITYFINLFVFLLMFLSPIGYRPDMVPQGFGWVVYLNPVFYMTEAYRSTILSGVTTHGWVAAAYVVMCVGTFAIGSAFFERFRGVLTDYE